MFARFPQVPRYLALAFALALLGVGPLPARASGLGSVTVSVSPDTIYADGKSKTIVSATVRDGGGNLAADGTTVLFTATSGTLDKDTAPTQSGVARVTLTSDSAPGTSLLKANSFLAGASSSGNAYVDFTTDRASANTSGESRWLQVDCPQYLVYSADSKTVEAQGRKGSAHLSYNTLEIEADALQVDLQSRDVIARNALIQRAHATVKAIQLRYNLQTNSGTAVVAGDEKHAAQTVQIIGYGLKVVPIPATDGPVDLQSNPYRFMDLSESRVVVSARSIATDFSTTVQFRRAAIYSDGKKILSLPLHTMPLMGQSSAQQQIFGSQLLGFGSQGLFINVPYYYDVSPRSTGTLFLRNSAAASAGLGGTTGIIGSRPGLALDLQQTYNFGRGGSGALIMDGINRSEWGAHWNHTQHIDDATSGYFFLDYPQHRSLFGSSSLSRQFSQFSVGMNATGSRDPGTNGLGGFQSTAASVYLQTNPHQVAASGINYVSTFSLQGAQTVADVPGGGTLTTPSSTRGIDLRFYTAALHPSRNTQLTDSLTVGQAWSNTSSRTSPTVQAVIGLSRAMPKQTQLNLNYNFRYDPLLTTTGTSYSLYNGPVQQRLSLNFVSRPTARLAFSASGNWGLLSHDTSIFTNLSYQVNNNWRLNLSTTLSQYASIYANYRYSETQLTIYRRIMGRELAFTYSSQTKKLRFDLAASSF